MIQIQLSIFYNKCAIEENLVSSKKILTAARLSFNGPTHANQYSILFAHIEALRERLMFPQWFIPDQKCSIVLAGHIILVCNLIV